MRLALAIALVAQLAYAKTEFGFFIDTQYAYDANEPADRIRNFSTNPSRHNEFNVNLVYVEGKLTEDRVRGRLALQTGTSVFANYSSELRDSTKPGGAQLADSLMHIQEAYAGYRLAEGLWVDAGLYFSHIGGEGFISKDNWNYTRSLVADFSPYYQAGVKLSWDPNPVWGFQLHLINGWQNILETNNDKALGTQVSYKPSSTFSVTHNSFLGRETELRFFQDLIVKYAFTPEIETALVIDLGLQRDSTDKQMKIWWGTALQARLKILDSSHLGLRLEYYEDGHQFIVSTGTANGFQVFGASANLDTQLLPGFLWRNEVRVLSSKDAIFASVPNPRSETVFGVSSISFSLQ